MKSLFWLPLRLLWTAVQVVALPGALMGVAWLVLPREWAWGVSAAAVVYVAGLAVLAVAAARGKVRSMARGSYTIRGASGRRRGE